MALIIIIIKSSSFSINMAPLVSFLLLPVDLRIKIKVLYGSFPFIYCTNMCPLSCTSRYEWPKQPINILLKVKVVYILRKTRIFSNGKFQILDHLSSFTSFLYNFISLCSFVRYLLFLEGSVRFTVGEVYSDNVSSFWALDSVSLECFSNSSLYSIISLFAH